MDYKYNAVNELNHFDFAEAVVGDIQLLGKMFHIVIDLRSVIAVNGGGGVKQSRKHIFFDIANIRCVFPHTVDNILDMLRI